MCWTLVPIAKEYCRRRSRFFRKWPLRAGLCIITSIANAAATARREDYSLTHYRFPIQARPKSKRPKSFAPRRQPPRWCRRTEPEKELSLRASLRVNYDMAVEKMRKNLDEGARIEAGWTE